MKILIAIDGSDYTRRVLDFVLAHRELLGEVPDVALVTSVHAIPSHAARFIARDALATYYDEEAEKVLAPAREVLAGAGIEAKSVQCKGAPAPTIAQYAASNGYELIVMGSHGHSALGNMVAGSVVTGVLALGRTAVLVVR